MFFCPICRKVSNNERCEDCTVSTKKLPVCRWCKNELWPYMKCCATCGRSKMEAIISSPPSQQGFKCSLYKLLSIIKSPISS